MIKLVRYNKGMLMTTAIKMQWLAAAFIVIFPILIGELKQYLHDANEIIFIIQAVSLSIGVVGYIVAVVIMLVVVFVYKPLFNIREKDGNRT